MRRICDNCKRGNSMCRYSPHDNPCPDFEPSEEMREEKNERIRNEIKQRLILRYAEILLKEGYARDFRSVGMQAREAAESVVNELGDDLKIAEEICENNQI